MGVVYEKPKPFIRENIRMYDEIVEISKRHIDGVKEALFSIEKALKSSFMADLVEIDMFRAELIRRALCHDSDKYSCMESFIEYTMGTHKFIMLGGYHFEHSDERRKQATCEAYKGLTALDRHKKSNDHHPEFYGSRLSGMSLIPMIEMVCDWYGAAYYTKFEKEEALCKFNKDFSGNMKHFSFDEYQTSVCNRLRDCLVDESDSIIRSIRDACISFSNKQYRASDGVLQTVNEHIEERFNKEVHGFLSKRRLELSPIIEAAVSGFNSGYCVARTERSMKEERVYRNRENHYAREKFSPKKQEHEDLVSLLDGRIKKLEGVRMVSDAQEYLGYQVPGAMEHPFVYINRRGLNPVLHLRIPSRTIKDPEGMCEGRMALPPLYNASVLTDHVTVKIHDPTQIDKSIPLIEQAYQHNLRHSRVKR